MKNIVKDFIDFIRRASIIAVVFLGIAVMLFMIGLFVHVLTHPGVILQVAFILTERLGVWWSLTPVSLIAFAAFCCAVYDMGRQEKPVPQRQL